MKECWYALSLFFLGGTNVPSAPLWIRHWPWLFTSRTVGVLLKMFIMFTVMYLGQDMKHILPTVSLQPYGIAIPLFRFQYSSSPSSGVLIMSIYTLWFPHKNNVEELLALHEHLGSLPVTWWGPCCSYSVFTVVFLFCSSSSCVLCVHCCRCL